MEVSGIRQKWKILMATKAPLLSPATMSMSVSVGGIGLVCYFTGHLSASLRTCGDLSVIVYPDRVWGLFIIGCCHGQV